LFPYVSYRGPRDSFFSWQVRVNPVVFQMKSAKYEDAEDEQYVWDSRTKQMTGEGGMCSCLEPFIVATVTVSFHVPSFVVESTFSMI